MRHGDRRIYLRSHPKPGAAGAGTLYTILAKFEEVGLIRETAVEGRKRTYALTDAGLERYEEELVRLRSCLADAEEERRAMDYEAEDGAQTVPG